MFADDASMFVDGEDINTMEIQLELSPNWNVFPHGYK